LTSSSGRQYFINVADVGIGAEVVRRTDLAPAWAGGTVSFLGGAVVSLMVHRNHVVRLTVDDRPALTRRVRTIAVANGGYFGGGMFIAPQAQVDDGVFEVVTIGDIGRLKGVVSLPMLYRGTHGRLEEVEFARGRRIEIESEDPIGIEADGELAGATPALFEILPGALQVIDWQPSGILSQAHLSD
jgi:diacylglycerol kinase family enzyme